MSQPTSPESLHPGVDLRHMTSNPVLSISPSKDHRTSHRVSQHLRMSPARSPTSIPSSPTSVHSSSSAIFERDIEPISPRSPSPQSHAHNHASHAHPPNPHRIPRSRTTEQLEHSVPSVLDAAASILTEETDQSEYISVLAPAQPGIFDFMGRNSGFASPIESFSSRSPSPTIGGRHQQSKSNSLLLSIPSGPAAVTGSPPGSSLAAGASVVSGSPPGTSALSHSPPGAGAPARPTIQPTASPISSAAPSILTPTSAYFSTTSEADTESPTTATREHPTATPTLTTSSSPQGQQPASNSHPPSPILSAAQKRLSFMSYSDLLSSTPASALPLSSLTTAASAVEPPPHIPGVTGLNHSIGSSMGSGNVSAATSLRGFAMGPIFPTSTSPNSPSSHIASPASHIGSLVNAGPNGGITHVGKRDSIALLDDVGGEWEREGLGRGLEERLEIVVGGARH